MIVALNIVFPYGVAFKLVAILGLVTLPVVLLGVRPAGPLPLPDARAVRPRRRPIFLFDESFSIYGGNVKCTMAGEFSFSIALSFAMLGLGLFARGLETGKFRSWAAILIALAMLCHGIVLIFVVARRGVVVGSCGWTAPGSSTASRPCCTARAADARSGSCRSSLNHAVHDRHEVRRPPRRRDRLVLGHVLPADRRSSTSSSPASRSSASSRRSCAATSAARGSASAAWR